MKKVALLFMLLPILAFSQVKSYNTSKEAEADIKSGKYKSSIGWELLENQELKLGRGSMPDKTFAFITEMPNILTYNSYTDYNRVKLPHSYNGRSCVIKDFMIAGSKKTGYWIVCRIKVGGVSRYLIDIENAIEAGELQLPAEFVKVKPTTTEKPDLADQVKKLKDLKDAGALTQEQYDAAIKKILE